MARPTTQLACVTNWVVWVISGSLPRGRKLFMFISHDSSCWCSRKLRPCRYESGVKGPSFAVQCLFFSYVGRLLCQAVIWPHRVISRWIPVLNQPLRTSVAFTSFSSLPELCKMYGVRLPRKPPFTFSAIWDRGFSCTSCRPQIKTWIGSARCPSL